MARKTLIPTMLEEASHLQGHMTQFQTYQSGFFQDNQDLLQAIADCAGCLVNLIEQLAAARTKGD